MGGLLIGRVLKPLKPILVGLGVLMVVLEVPPPSSFTEASEVCMRVTWMPLVLGASYKAGEWEVISWFLLLPPG